MVGVSKSRKSRSSRIDLTSFVVLTSLASGVQVGATEAIRNPIPQATAAAVAAISGDRISQEEARTLMASFRKALAGEMAALKHQQDFELKDLKAAQSARRSEFESRENAARREFRKQNPKGPELRKYIQDFRERQKVMLDLMKDEATRRKQEQQARRESLKRDQEQRLKDFDEAIRRGERPSRDLWPRS